MKTPCQAAKPRQADKCSTDRSRRYDAPLRQRHASPFQDINDDRNLVSGNTFLEEVGNLFDASFKIRVYTNG